MKKLLLVAVAGLSVLAGTQLQARKVCDMVLKSEGFTQEGRCAETIPGETFQCKDVTCPACPSLSCPPCMCEAPKKVECNCTPSITVDESCHEVCTSCRQLKADCGCGSKHAGHNHKAGRRNRRSQVETVVE